MPKLYEIAEDFRAVEEALLEAEDEELKEILKSSLETVEGELEAKLEGMVKLMKNFEAEAEMFKAEEKRLQAKKQAAQKRADSIKEYMDFTLKSLGIKKAQAGLWKLTIQKNPPSLDIHDESKIPEEYFVTKRELDKRELLKALKNGSTFAGVELKQSESLRVR